MLLNISPLTQVFLTLISMVVEVFYNFLRKVPRFQKPGPKFRISMQTIEHHTVASQTIIIIQPLDYHLIQIINFQMLSNDVP